MKTLGAELPVEQVAKGLEGMDVKIPNEHLPALNALHEHATMHLGEEDAPKLGVPEGHISDVMDKMSMHDPASGRALRLSPEHAETLAKMADHGAAWHGKKAETVSMQPSVREAHAHYRDRLARLSVAAMEGAKVARAKIADAAMASGKPAPIEKPAEVTPAATSTNLTKIIRAHEDAEEKNLKAAQMHDHAGYLKARSGMPGAIEAYEEHLPMAKAASRIAQEATHSEVLDAPEAKADTARKHVAITKISIAPSHSNMASAHRKTAAEHRERVDELRVLQAAQSKRQEAEPKAAPAAEVKVEPAPVKRPDVVVRLAKKGPATVAAPAPTEKSRADLASEKAWELSKKADAGEVPRHEAMTAHMAAARLQEREGTWDLKKKHVEEQARLNKAHTDATTAKLSAPPLTLAIPTEADAAAYAKRKAEQERAEQNGDAFDPSAASMRLGRGATPLALGAQDAPEKAPEKAQVGLFAPEKPSAVPPDKMRRMVTDALRSTQGAGGYDGVQNLAQTISQKNFGNPRAVQPREVQEALASMMKTGHVEMKKTFDGPVYKHTGKATSASDDPNQGMLFGGMQPTFAQAPEPEAPELTPDEERDQQEQRNIEKRIAARRAQIASAPEPEPEPEAQEPAAAVEQPAAPAAPATGKEESLDAIDREIESWEPKDKKVMIGKNSKLSALLGMKDRGPAEEDLVRRYVHALDREANPPEGSTSPGPATQAVSEPETPPQAPKEHQEPVAAQTVEATRGAPAPQAAPEAETPPAHQDAAATEATKEQYRYGAHYRPFAYANVPNGFTKVEDHPDFAHGVGTYDRPLTPEEQKSYQLTKIPTDDEKKAVEDKVVERLAKYGKENVEEADNYHDSFVRMHVRPTIGETLEKMNVHLTKAETDDLVKNAEARLREHVSKQQAETPAAPTPETAPKLTAEQRAAQGAANEAEMAREDKAMDDAYAANHPEEKPFAPVYGQHVIANGEHGIYLGKDFLGEHMVDTAKKAASAQTVEPPPEGTTPPEGAIKRFHAGLHATSPSPTHAPAHQAAGKPNWYLDRDGKYRWLDEPKAEVKTPVAAPVVEPEVTPPTIAEQVVGPASAPVEPEPEPVTPPVAPAKVEPPSGVKLRSPEEWGGHVAVVGDTTWSNHGTGEGATASRNVTFRRNDKAPDRKVNLVAVKDGETGTYGYHVRTDGGGTSSRFGYDSLKAAQAAAEQVVEQRMIAEKEGISFHSKPVTLADSTAQGSLFGGAKPAMGAVEPRDDGDYKVPDDEYTPFKQRVGGQDKWAVRRKSTGGGSLVSDLFDTREEADKHVDLKRRQQESSDRMRAEAERSRAEKKASDDAIESQHEGFLDKFAPHQKANASSALSRVMTIGKGEPKTVREHIRDLVDKGYRVATVPKMTPWSKADGEKKEGTERVLRGPDGSFFDERTFSKTGLDFAEHLAAKRGEPDKEHPAAADEPAKTAPAPFQLSTPPTSASAEAQASDVEPVKPSPEGPQTLGDLLTNPTMEDAKAILERQRAIEAGKLDPDAERKEQWRRETEPGSVALDTMVKNLGKFRKGEASLEEHKASFEGGFKHHKAVIAEIEHRHTKDELARLTKAPSGWSKDDMAVAYYKKLMHDHLPFSARFAHNTDTTPNVYNPAEVTKKHFDRAINEETVKENGARMAKVREEDEAKFKAKQAEAEKELAGGDFLKHEYAKDIPMQVAVAAHQWTSQDPEERGASQVKNYVHNLLDFKKRLTERAEAPEQKEIAEREFDKFREGSKTHMLDYLHRKGQTASPGVVGPAKFPTARNDKREDALGKAAKEYVEWDRIAQARALRAIDKAGPDGGRGSISSDDKDAPAKYKARIKALEQDIQYMHHVNDVVRNKGMTEDQKLKELQARLGLSEGEAKAELLRKEPGHQRGYGYYNFTNANANVERMRQKVREIEARRSEKPFEAEIAGVKVEDDVEGNRVRMHFPGKPKPEVIAELRSNGFVWSPSNGTWQRKRGEHANYAVDRVLKKLDDGEHYRWTNAIGESRRKKPE